MVGEHGSKQEEEKSREEEESHSWSRNASGCFRGGDRGQQRVAQMQSLRRGGGSQGKL